MKAPSKSFRGRRFVTVILITSLIGGMSCVRREIDRRSFGAVGTVDVLRNLLVDHQLRCGALPTAFWELRSSQSTCRQPDQEGLLVGRAKAYGFWDKLVPGLQLEVNGYRFLYERLEDGFRIVAEPLDDSLPTLSYRLPDEQIQLKYPSGRVEYSNLAKRVSG